MANSLSTNPIIIDTEGTTSAITDTIIVTKIAWVNEASDEIADGNILEILDASGGNKIIYTIATGTTPKIEWNFPGGQIFQGFYVNDLDSGLVFVYLK